MLNTASDSFTLKSKSSQTIQRFSPAKINLFLHITDRRKDGYHNLQTVFRLLNWGDTLDFSITNKQFNPNQPIDNDNLPIILDSNVKLTDSPLDNLITKAAIKLIAAMTDPNLLLSLTKKDGLLADTLPVVHVSLDKVIPAGAGLGGGSSNAATTLLALNELWELNLDTASLITIGAKVGADVPIFIAGTDSIAEGIGELLTPVTLPVCHYLLLMPKAHINTAQLFANPTLCRNTQKLAIARLCQDKQSYDYKLSPPYSNVFEPVVTTLSPPVAEALDFLRTLEPITGSTARMTGTGSCVFLPYHANHYEQLQLLVKDAPCCAYFVSNL